MVQVCYDDRQSAQLPDKFQWKPCDIENCGLFAELTYITTWSKTQFIIDISPEDDKFAPYRPPYCLSPPDEAELQRQLEKALCNSWIRPSSSDYSSPVPFVPKNHGGMCMGIDHRAVNRITRKDRCPSPHVEELVQPLGGADCFSMIDSASGHQIWICTSDRQKTAFSTEYEL